LGAANDRAGAESKTGLSRLKVGHAVTGRVKTLSPDDLLGDVVAIVIHSYQEDFPVLLNGQLVGILTRSNLINGLHRLGPGGQVSQVMERDFPVVTTDAPFSEAYEKMNQAQLKAVPVMVNDRLVGMITLEHLSDIFMLLSATDKPFMPRQ
jgi:CBS domain-containing protein